MLMNHPGCPQQASSKERRNQLSTARPRSRQAGKVPPGSTGPSHQVPTVEVPMSKRKNTGRRPTPDSASFPSGKIQTPRSTLTRATSARRCDAKKPIAKNEGLTQVQIAQLQSSDPTHIVNGRCKVCLDDGDNCQKLFKRKACLECHDKKKRCSISGEMGAYWDRLYPKRDRSRSRSRASSAGPSRTSSATPPPSSTAPSRATSRAASRVASRGASHAALNVGGAPLEGEG